MVTVSARHAEGYTRLDVTLSADDSPAIVRVKVIDEAYEEDFDGFVALLRTRLDGIATAGVTT